MIHNLLEFLAGATGLEPATSGVTDLRNYLTTSISRNIFQQL